MLWCSNNALSERLLLFENGRFINIKSAKVELRDFKS